MQRKKPAKLVLILFGTLVAGTLMAQTIYCWHLYGASCARQVTVTFADGSSQVCNSSGYYQAAQNENNWNSYLTVCPVWACSYSCPNGTSGYYGTGYQGNAPCINGAGGGPCN